MHCKDVSIHEVDVGLDPQSIAGLMDGWRSYVRTEGLVLRHGDEYAVVELHKADGSGLFREVDGYRIVSLPEDTVYVEDPDLDVLNLPAMAAVASRHPGKTVVVRGMFSHISYMSGVEPMRLAVVDSVPPTPAKLGVLVRIALMSGYVEHPVVPELTVIDMADKVGDVRTPGVMFPCRVSNLSADRPYFFLDDAPEPDVPVTLIGCHLSRRIYRDLYGSDVPFISVCPADHIDPSQRTIVKCCKVKSGHEREGNVVRVPWGATVPEVVDALNDLFSDSRGPARCPC